MITPARLPMRPGRSDHHMLAKNDVRFRETGEQSPIDHCLRARPCFLRRLEHRHQRAFPGISRLSQESGRADQPRHVHVVTACVHDGDGLACAIGRRLCAGVGQAGLFSDR